MKTYQGDKEKKKDVDMDVTASMQTDEDIMLAGGFDTFSPPPQNNMGTTMPLADVEHSYMNNKYMDQKYVTLSSSENPVLSLKEQFFHAFHPFQYSCYNSMSMGDAKAFARWFSRLYIEITYFGFLFMLAVNPNLIRNNLSNPYAITIRQLRSPVMILLISLVFLGMVAIAPIYYRITAWFLRLIGKVVSLISGKHILDTHMYLVSIYALVPYHVLCVIPVFFCPVPLLYEILRAFFPLIGLAIAIINMCIGVFTIE